MVVWVRMICAVRNFRAHAQDRGELDLISSMPHAQSDTHAVATSLRESLVRQCLPGLCPLARKCSEVVRKTNLQRRIPSVGRGFVPQLLQSRRGNFLAHGWTRGLSQGR
jgi:hypothetical protein